jgi:hypothetical protein
MSVYLLGKLKGDSEACRSFLWSAAYESGLGLHFEIDPEDEKVLDEPEEIRGEGLTFMTTSEPGDSVDWEICEAWNAARESGREALSSDCPGFQTKDLLARLDEVILPDPVLSKLAGTSLGKFVSAVVGFGEISGGGLALFDGGVRAIVRATPEICLRRILTAFLLPWDASPDALYVWTRGRGAHA